jgi:hypothetical protein
MSRSCKNAICTVFVVSHSHFVYTYVCGQIASLKVSTPGMTPRDSLHHITLRIKIQCD